MSADDTDKCKNPLSDPCHPRKSAAKWNFPVLSVICVVIKTMSLYSAIIAGTGSHVPEKRLTNDDLSKMVETNDEWITQRTGIKERRIAGKDESTATLASHAATKAMKAAGVEA